MQVNATSIGGESATSGKGKLHRIMSRDQWLAATARHVHRVARDADAFVRRRSRGAKHPVHDFLFTYYSFSPAKLKQWLPPMGTWLEVAAGDIETHLGFARPEFALHDGRVGLNETRLGQRTRELAAWIANLSRGMLVRPTRFTCFGLHEWAMVYRQPVEQIRHQGWKLRVPPDEIAGLLESQTLCCSHYDAFRFFAAGAKPLNTLAPTLECRPRLEQAACLHANMDLYKWAYKLWPWVGSDLIADAFLLAREARKLDMRASPYDLSELGYESIPIETQLGRETYVAEQRRIAMRAEPVRRRLVAACETLMGGHGASTTAARQGCVCTAPAPQP